MVCAIGEELQGCCEKVQVGDLMIYWKDEKTRPPHMLSAMKWGTKFWDAFIYFGLPVADRPMPKKGEKTPHSRPAMVRDNCVYIAWMSMSLLRSVIVKRQLHSHCVDVNVPSDKRLISSLLQDAAAQGYPVDSVQSEGHELQPKGPDEAPRKI
jgi:hypothetical protein